MFANSNVKSVLLCGLLILSPTFVFGQFAQLDLTPANPAAGIITSHAVQIWTTVDIPANGKIVFDYSGTFGVNGVTMTSSSIDGSFLYAYDPANSQVIVSRSGDGTTTTPGILSLTLSGVTNETNANIYTVYVETQTSGGSVIQSGTSSNFSITHNLLSTFTMTMGTTQTAGSAFTLNITDATDVYGNFWAGTINISAGTGGGNSPGGDPPVYNPVVITTGGSGSADQTLTNAVPTTLEGTADGSTVTSASITVNPAAMNDFVVTVPSGNNQVAGQPFFLSVSSAVDIYQNPWVGSVTVSVASGGGNSPNGTPPTFTPITVSGGVGSASQILTNAISTRLQGEADGVTRSTADILVSNGGIANFTITAGITQTAGIPFSLSVTGAVDAYGNIWDGSINVSASSGGGDSPGGNSPTYQSIAIAGGAGSADQTLTNAVPTVLQGEANGVTRDTPSITVDPAGLEDFTMTLPTGSTQLAGIAFPLAVSGAIDAFQNPWRGTVTIATYSGGGNSPGGTAPTLSDITVDNGTGSANQTLTNAVPTVFQGSGSATRYSPVVNVQAGPLNTYTLSALSPQSAGVAFDLTVTGAVDGFGNIWSGLVTIDASTGGGAAPDGTLPSLNDIYVNGGTGSAKQTLTNAVSTVLHGLATGLDQYTSSIQVDPGALFEFELTGVQAATIAGEDFTSPITATAYDAFRNVKTNYFDDVHFESSDDAQANFFHHATNEYTFTAGDAGQHIFDGSLFQLRTAGTRTITMKDDNNSVEVTSPTIQVSYAEVNTFTLAAGGTQTAGVPFELSVTNARDAFNNLWSGDVTVSIVGTDHESPDNTVPVLNDIRVVNGAGAADQTLVKRENGIGLQAEAPNGIIQTRSGINVNAAPLAELRIRNGAGGTGEEVVTVDMIVNEELRLYSAGYDAFGNFRIDETTNWTSTGLTPILSRTGFSTISYVPTAPGSGTIQATEGASGISDHTGTITASAGAVVGFDISLINTQIVGQPFTITVTAQDVHGNTVLGFNGTVDITDLTGTINPTVSTNFVNGVWVHGITVFDDIDNNVITVTQTGGGPSGSSNAFNVVAAPGIQIIDFQALRSDTTTELSSITTDQEVDWFLKMRVQNLGSANVRLDSVGVHFLVDGIQRTDYVLDKPTVFWGNGANTLDGGANDSLLIKIETTGHDPGPGTIQGFLYLSNTLTGGILRDQALITADIQTPAELIVQDIVPSIGEATLGQIQRWEVSVAVHNGGGSAVTIDTTNGNPPLLPGIPSVWTGWQIERPDTLAGGGWTVEGGSTDYIVYHINITGQGVPDTVRFHTIIDAVEDNTGRELTYATQNGEEGKVKLEMPAHLRMVNVQNLAPNAPYVNVAQTFQIRVTVQNDGGDGLHDTVVRLVSDGLSIFPPLPVEIGDLAGGETKSVDLTGTADNVANPMEIFMSSVEGWADNNEEFILNQSALEDTTKAIIQNRANLIVESVTTSETSLIGGQVDPWSVKVAVRNMGEATVLLDAPKADDISFWNKGLFQNDYKITAPLALKGGGLTLGAGDRDSLIYMVSATGRLGGQVEVRAQAQGQDQNIEAALLATGTTVINIQSEDAFRIISTSIKSLNKTDAGNAYVNTSQDFEVVVVVENGLGETVTDIELNLVSNGSSLDTTLTANIDEMAPASWDSVKFEVQSNDLQNLVGEKFTASIKEAVLDIANQPAPIGTALDSTAIIYIQTPAKLEMTLTLSNDTGLFSTNQLFTVKVQLENLGTGLVDDAGVVRIELPANYNLDNATPSDSYPIAVGTDVEWTVQAPASPQAAQMVHVTLFPFPNQLNSGEPAEVEKATLSSEITTLQSILNTTLSITSPVGAMDATVSTGQDFTVKAKIQRDNVKDIKARIQLPFGFSTVDNNEKSVVTDEVHWQVYAPSDMVLSFQIIQVTTKGVDSLQTDVEVVGNVAQLVVNSVARADMALSMSIQGPADATDGTVSLGQTFQVQARVDNLGAADTLGTGGVTLSPLPSGYSTSEPMTKTLVNGMTMWNIVAPLQPTGEAVNIEAKITTVPLDENTNRASDVSRGNHSVAVTTEGAWLAMQTMPVLSDVGSSVIPDQGWVKLMILELDNRGIAGANRILVSRMDFQVEDRLGSPIIPSAVLAELFVVNEADTTEVFGRTTIVPDENPLSVTMTHGLEIPVDQDKQIAVYGRIPQSPTAPFFQLNIPNEDFVDAKDVDSGIAVPVRNVMDEELLDLRSDPKRIFQPGQEVTFKNVPNPFGEPGKDQTTFIYYLRENTNVSFKLFTLTGEPVWSVSYQATDPQGAAGIHSSGSNAVTWDARNHKGFKVLNGVYILVMQTGYGEILKTKVAVVK